MYNNSHSGDEESYRRPLPPTRDWSPHEQRMFFQKPPSNRYRQFNNNQSHDQNTVSMRTVSAFGPKPKQFMYTTEQTDANEQQEDLKDKEIRELKEKLELLTTQDTDNINFLNKGRNRDI